MRKYIRSMGFAKRKKMSKLNTQERLATKVRYIKCYIWSLLYSAETWTIMVSDEKGLKSYEIWILKIP